MEAEDRVKLVKSNCYEGYSFWCPGCEEHHVISTIDETGRPRWTFNGDLVKPTFNPSLLCNPPAFKERHRDFDLITCHSFIRNGQIQFLADCDHRLAGQTVDIEPYRTVQARLEARYRESSSS